MGLDLRLLPFEHESDNLAFSHTVLDMDRDSELFDNIADLEGAVVPANFRSYVGRRSDGEIGYGPTPTTPYGDPVKWVPAGDLVGLGAPAKSVKNRAVFAYLCALPADAKIALFWS